MMPLYLEDLQRSLANASERRIYDREFLMKLRDAPNSKIEPLNLPNVDVVLNTKTAESSSYTLPVPQKRGKFPGNHSLRNKLRLVDRIISYLQKDFAIRKTENPGEEELRDLSKEDSAPKDLYKKAQDVLNRMSNYSEEHLQAIVDMIFEKAVNEPNFIAVCALLCKEFAGMRVTVPNSEAGNDESIVDFRTIIIKRCLTEFEDAKDENERAALKRDIESSEDPATNEFWKTLTEEERRLRTRSFRNVRFMGELFKHRMLTSFNTQKCIRYLLAQIEDESLECLCKLLSSVGKDMESKDQCLEPYFDDILKIVNREIPGEEEKRSTIVSHEDEEKDEDTPKGPPPLKYTYSADQWSPLNVSGRKVYEREFLMQLQTDPSSKIKPTNLPDLEVVLKDNSRNRGAVDMRQFKDVGLDSRHASLFPGFVKSQSTRGSLTPTRSSRKDSPKLTKQNVIKVSMSLKEDAELKETENRGNSSDTMKPNDTDEEEIKTETLYKKFREVLDTLSPETFDTLVDQVRKLQIDSLERLHGLSRLLFQKAINKPDSCGIYACMCKKLRKMQVDCSDNTAGKEESNVDFGKLIVNHCQMEFEKNSGDENARAIKMKEIEACPDPDKTKELLHILNEEERKIRVKSVGNIRFMGELFKQGMFATSIMHRCIRYLLTQTDGESLECLCSLLIMIGKVLESKGQSLDEYFEKMREIANSKGPEKVSSRVRFKLLYLIDLRSNKWVSSIAECNPKTLDRAETKPTAKSSHVKVNNRSTNIAREDIEIKRNCEDFHVTEKKIAHVHLPQNELQGDLPTKVSKKERNKDEEDDSRALIECELSPLTSVETLELKNKSPTTEDLRLGNKNMLKSPRTIAVDTSKIVTPNKLAELENTPSEQAEPALPLSGSFSINLVHRTAIIVKEYLSDTGDTSIRNTALKVRETYDDTTFVNFVREALNSVVQKTVTDRKRLSQLMTHLIFENILPLPLYLVGLGEVLNNTEDLVGYIPEIWVYLAELFWYPLAEGVLPFGQLKTTMGSLKRRGLARDLMVELTIVLVQEKNPKWVKDKWDESGLRWRDFLPESESTDFADQFESDFLVVASHSASSNSLESQLSMEDIRDQLIRLMSSEKLKSLTNITNWISTNVGRRIIESEFVKVLMAAILEVSIEPYDKTWQFRVDKFRNVRALIPRYIDVSMKLLELQFLISIQEYIHQLDYPQSLHLQTIEKQTIESIISLDVFDLLVNDDNLRPPNRKSLAILALKSFFTSLKEKRD